MKITKEGTVQYTFEEEYFKRVRERKLNKNLSKFHVWFPTYRNRNKKRGIYEQPTRNKRV